jgi:hypothetical protein
MAKNSRFQSIDLLILQGPQEMSPPSRFHWHSSLSRALFHLSLRVPGQWAPLQVTQWGPYAERCPSPEPSFMNPSGSSVNKPLLQVPLAKLPHSETLYFQRPLSSVSNKSPRSTRPHQVPQWGPYGVRSPASEPSLMHSSGGPVREPSFYVTLKVAPSREMSRFQIPLLLPLEVPGTPISPLRSPFWAHRKKDTHLLSSP